MTRSAIIADADLMIRAGTAEGHLRGSGSRLSFETHHIAPFLGSTPDGWNRGVQDAVNQLASLGISVAVIEDGVALFDVGHVKSSLITRPFGVRNIRIRRPFRLLARYLRR